MNALEAYLTKNNLNCSEFARISGLKQPTVWRIKTGSSRPSAAVALVIEQATNGEVTIRELLYPEK